MIKKITKILFLAVFGYLAVDANAQSQVYSNDKLHPAVDNQDPIITRTQSHLFKKSSYQGWFYPTIAINAALADEGFPLLKSYVDFLTTDSNVKIIPTTGASYFNHTHLAGSTFDPKDESYGITPLDQNGDPITDGNGDPIHGTNLTEWNPYKVDSVIFRYLYVRKLDSAIVNSKKVKVVDTLIFQFHNPSTLSFGITGGTPGEVFGKPKTFSRTIGGATGATYTEKIPLTDLDSTTVTSTGWRSKAMIIAIPSSVAGAAKGKDQNQVAFNIFFKQMIPNKDGDTIEAQNGAIIKNPVNYAGYSQYQNENDVASQIKQIKYRSNAYFTESKQLYGQAPNGWSNYIPGNAYFMKQYMFCAFHFTTPNLKASDVNKSGYGLGTLSPNPAQAGQDVNVAFTLGNSENVTFTVSDILGKTLKTVNTQKLNAGLNTITFNTANLAPGIYIYTVSAGSFKASKKFTVTN